MGAQQRHFLASVPHTPPCEHSVRREDFPHPCHRCQDDAGLPAPHPSGPGFTVPPAPGVSWHHVGSLGTGTVSHRAHTSRHLEDAQQFRARDSAQGTCTLRALPGPAWPVTWAGPLSSELVDSPLLLFCHQQPVSHVGSGPTSQGEGGTRVLAASWACT